MNRITISLFLLIILAVVFNGVTPAFGKTPHVTAVSGLECVYVIKPGQVDITGEVMRIKGQVNQNYFYSDDPSVLPNGTNTAVINVEINLQSGMVTWRSTAAEFKPDGIQGSFVGKGGGWIKMDPVTFAVMASKGLGVFHGTGELEGMTMKQDLYAGDISQCPPAPNLFDATIWEGFIVPITD